MTDVRVVTEETLRQTMHIDSVLIDAIEDGFTALAAGRVVMPPIMRLDIPEHNGEVDVKTAYIPGLDSFAIKVSPGFFDNHLLGLPSTSGLMVLFSAETGFVKAVLLDNGYLTDLRTGAAGAVAAKHLAPQTLQTAGVIGAGAQARYQLLALQQVRSFDKLLVYSRSPEHVQAYITDMQPQLNVPIEAAPSAEAVVRNSQVVVTTTPAEDGYLKADWLHPSLHITAMGSDAENKQELDANVFRHADLIVCDRKSQSFRLGELHHALDAGILMENHDTIELGDITGGNHPGRTDDNSITVCDLTGTGMQDTIAARLAYATLATEDNR